MQVVLFEPEIPPNTGSVARLCAATRTPLHLVEPLGFSIDDKHLKRAGLDYWPQVNVSVWPDWQAFVQTVSPARLVLTSARRGVPYHEAVYRRDDCLVFGPETRGLPEDLYTEGDVAVRIPIWGEVRSINLSNAVGVVLYEAYRQTGALAGR